MLEGFTTVPVPNTDTGIAADYISPLEQGIMCASVFSSVTGYLGTLVSTSARNLPLGFACFSLLASGAISAGSITLVTARRMGIPLFTNAPIS